jgi:hypothetical protein
MKRALTYLGFSAVLSYAFGVVFVLVLFISHPAATVDKSMAPYILLLLMALALVYGLCFWPLFAFFGWKICPDKAATIAGATGLLYLIGVTPFSPQIGWFGAHAAGLVALIAYTIFVRPGLPETAPELPPR